MLVVLVVLVLVFVLVELTVENYHTLAFAISGHCASRPHADGQPCFKKWGVMNAPHPAVFKDAFSVFLVAPPPGGPGEVPDCHFPQEIDDLGADFGPIPEGNLILIYI
jgi:hypothetical protein